MHLPRNDEDCMSHYVYDCTLEIEERVQERLVFRSGTAAANWLGVLPQRVFINRKTRNRIWSDKHQKWFAVRIAK